MRLTLLECRDFRRLESVSFAPAPGWNVLRGGNAQGKTTVLEAILYAATSKSHRTTQDRDLVRHGAEGFHVRASAMRLDRETVIDAYWWKGAKRFKVNGVPQTRLSDILGRIQVVFFSPEDMDLVQGAAAGRRRLLDMALAQLDGAYLAALQSYRQVLRQRNELLRSASPDGAQLDVWDEQLARHGREVAARRAAYLGALAGHAQAAYAAIADAERFEAAYAPDIGPEEDFLAILQKQRGSDLKYRVTGRGPHRDDVEFRIGDRAARVYASHGQQKTAVLAMKLGMLKLVRGRIGEYPVLLLDEVLAELDAERSRRLFAALPEGVQCIVTTTDSYAREQWFGKEAAHFVVEEGQVRAG